MEDHWNFDLDGYLENDPICKILSDSYEKYGFDFKKDCLELYQNLKNHKKCVDIICERYNNAIQEFFNGLS